MPTSLDGLVLKPPHPQNSFDLFRGEWAYDIPVANTQTGAAQQFKHKYHSVWMAEQAFGSLKGMSCLELGPNEGEVSFHLHHAGCSEVLAIEGRVRSYLKCLMVKNFLQMHSVTYLLGDFVQFLQQTDRQYDLCMAAGVLYHMTNPLQLLEMVCRRAERVAISSHYFNERMLTCEPSQDTTGLPPAVWNIADPDGEELTHGGLTARVYKYFYAGALDKHETFGHGGPAAWAYLMTKDDIIRALEHYGMRIVGQVNDDPAGPRGAHVHLIAARASG